MGIYEQPDFRIHGVKSHESCPGVVRGQPHSYPLSVAVFAKCRPGSTERSRRDQHRQSPVGTVRGSVSICTNSASGAGAGRPRSTFLPLA